MKKIFIYASVVGLAMGVVYWLYKKEQVNKTVSKLVDNREDFEPKYQEEEVCQGTDIVEEMYQAKDESVQAVYERHSEAGEIIKDVYRNIMEDFVEDFSNEKVVNENEKTKEVVVDNESASVLKALDSISDELDALLK